MLERHMLLPILGLADLRLFVSRVRKYVHDRNPHADFKIRALAANLVDHQREEARPVLELAAVGAGPRARAEQLVQQIPMAALHVHKVKARVPGQFRGADEILADAFQFPVGENRVIRFEPDARVEDRVMTGNLRRALALRHGKPPRMGQLKSGIEVVGLFPGLGMTSPDFTEQLRQSAAGLRIPVEVELPRVGPPVFLDGEGFPAPDQLRPAQPEAMLTAQSVLGRHALGRAVPTLHRMHGEAVADLAALEIERLGELPVGWDIFIGAQGRVERAQMLPELCDCLMLPRYLVLHFSPFRTPTRRQAFCFQTIFFRRNRSREFGSTRCSKSLFQS